VKKEYVEPQMTVIELEAPVVLLDDSYEKTPGIGGSIGLNLDVRDDLKQG